MRPFPDVDRGRWPMSTGSGTRPLWARNGRELFYLDGNNLLTVVSVQTGATFSASTPVRMFTTRYFSGFGGGGPSSNPFASFEPFGSSLSRELQFDGRDISEFRSFAAPLPRSPCNDRGHTRSIRPNSTGHRVCASWRPMFNASRLRVAVAETLREIGLLITVFVPVDFLFSQGSGVALGVVIAITTVGVLLTIGGILIGARR